VRLRRGRRGSKLDRICAFCGAECSPAIGVSQELMTKFWGGKTGFKIQYTGRQDLFFCNDRHRSAALYPKPEITESDDED